jgi:hypothetical protein
MRNNKSLFVGIIVLFLALIFVPSVFAQTASGDYFIAGISTKEDIGGVEVSSQYRDNRYRLVFENYNNFPVSVIFEFKDNIHSGKLTGTNSIKSR